MAGVGERDQLADGVRPAREHLLVEQVQRRVLEDDDGDGADALDPDGSASGSGHPDMVVAVAWSHDSTRTPIVANFIGRIVNNTANRELGWGSRSGTQSREAP